MAAIRAEQKAARMQDTRRLNDRIGAMTAAAGKAAGEADAAAIRRRDIAAAAETAPLASDEQVDPHGHPCAPTTIQACGGECACLSLRVLRKTCELLA